MFELPDPKLFRDVIHGYIKVPRCFVENIIDTAFFQRLRNIDQTGMRILYPDAKHDRFGHSLGVYHLGCQAADALLENFRNSKSKYWYVRSDDSLNSFWAKNKVLFLIACLLHDIGHAPFSHAMENELHIDAGAEKFDVKLAEELGIRYEELAKQKAASHEKIGAYLIVKHLREPVEIILNYLNAKEYPSRHQSALMVEPITRKSFVKSDEINEDMKFIARMVLGLKYSTEFDSGNYMPEKQIRNCFIELLNGEKLDVDKLDYIMRDTQVSGIKNTSIDVERLLGAISIVTLTRTIGDVNISEEFSERTLIQKIVPSINATNPQITIRGYIDGTIVIKTGSIVEIGSNVDIIEMRRYGDEEAKIAANEKKTFHFTAPSTEHSHLNIDGIEQILPYDDGGERVRADVSYSIIKHVTCFAKCITTKNSFKFEVVSGEYTLMFKGDCQITINGKFGNVSPFIINRTLATDGEIKGQSIQLDIVGDRIKREVPSQHKYNLFSIGFKKSAIGNISAVLDARDNLYKWVYAHHKVMYYANFLIPVITQSLLRDKLIRLIRSDDLYKNIISIDDSFVWMHVKKQYSEGGLTTDNIIIKLVNELVERRYKKSLYKSLPEYDVIFETFTIDKKRKMYKKFKENIIKCNYVHYNKYLDNEKVIQKRGHKSHLEEPVAGFIDKNFIEKIYGSNEHSINNLVWLAAQYKHKELDMKTTYLIYTNETPTTLSRIDLLCNALSLPSSDTSHYFYLYFDVNNLDGEDIERLKTNFIKALVAYDWMNDND